MTYLAEETMLFAPVLGMQMGMSRAPRAMLGQIPTQIWNMGHTIVLPVDSPVLLQNSLENVSINQKILENSGY